MVHMQSGFCLATHTSLLLHDAIEIVNTLSMIYADFMVLYFIYRLRYEQYLLQREKLHNYFHMLYGCNHKQERSFAGKSLW